MDPKPADPWDDPTRVRNAGVPLGSASARGGCVFVAVAVALVVGVSYAEFGNPGWWPLLLLYLGPLGFAGFWAHSIFVGSHLVHQTERPGGFSWPQTVLFALINTAPVALLVVQYGPGLDEFSDLGNGLTPLIAAWYVGHVVAVRRIANDVRPRPLWVWTVVFVLLELAGAAVWN